LLHLVGSSILFYVIDDARTNKNQKSNVKVFRVEQYGGHLCVRVGNAVVAA